jgi:hypothetical protein
MNPTFTIESVHGVKQTVIMVPTGTAEASSMAGPQSQSDGRGDSRQNGGGDKSR